MGDAANIKIAEINAQAALNQAQIAADASRFGTKTAAGASMYGADQGLAGTNVAANASMYGADKQAASAAAQTSAFRDVSAMRDAGETRRNQATIDAGIVNTGIANAPYSQSSTNAMDTASQRYTAPRMGYLSGSNTSPSASSLTPRVSGGGDNSLTKGMSEGTFELDGASRRFSKGTAKVPGHGDGTVDTVDAKLAPGEAVLNKAAAEMLGRGLIDLLNKHGMLQMGMPDPKEEAAEGEPGYAAGCSKVGYARGTSNVGGSTGDGARGPYLNRSGSSGRADTEAPMSFFPTGERGDGGTGPAPTVPSHYGITDRGENGSTGNGSPYMHRLERGATPRYARGTARVPMPPTRPMGLDDVPPEIDVPEPDDYIPQPPRMALTPSRPAPMPPRRPAGVGVVGDFPGESAPSMIPAFGMGMTAPSRASAANTMNMPLGTDTGIMEPPQARGSGTPGVPMMVGSPMSGGRQLTNTSDMPPELEPIQPVDSIPGPPKVMQPTPNRPAGPPNINNQMSFDQAFKAARDAFGGQGGAFNWRGHDYQTNVKGEKYAKNPVKF